MTREEIVNEIILKRDSEDPTDIARVAELRDELTKMDALMERAYEEFAEEGSDEYHRDGLNSIVELEILKKRVKILKLIVVLLLTMGVLAGTILSLSLQQYLLAVYICIPCFVALLISLFIFNAYDKLIANKIIQTKLLLRLYQKNKVVENK